MRAGKVVREKSMTDDFFLDEPRPGNASLRPSSRSRVRGVTLEANQQAHRSRRYTRETSLVGVTR